MSRPHAGHRGTENVSIRLVTLATVFTDCLLIFAGGLVVDLAYQGVKEYAEMKISTMCEPWQDPKTLEERKSNRIVALPLNKMEGHTKEYCGKEIVAHYRGKTIGGLIAWDGCVACDGNVSYRLFIDWKGEWTRSMYIDASRY